MLLEECLGIIGGILDGDDGEAGKEEECSIMSSMIGGDCKTGGTDEMLGEE
jgi:hypothetical protein